MKLTVNKNKAKLLEDLTIIEDKKTLAINLLKGTNVQHVKIHVVTRHVKKFL